MARVTTKRPRGEPAVNRPGMSLRSRNLSISTSPMVPDAGREAHAEVGHRSRGLARQLPFVAEVVIRAAAEIAVTWEHDEITRDEATTLISAWMNYLPGSVSASARAPAAAPSHSTTTKGPAEG